MGIGRLGGLFLPEHTVSAGTAATVDLAIGYAVGTNWDLLSFSEFETTYRQQEP